MSTKSEEELSRRGKIWPLLLTIGLVAAVLSPIHESMRGARGDSFPLSWYPMFSRSRPDPEWAHYIVGFTKDGERHFIRSKFYVSGAMNQARRQLDHLVRSRKTARRTCELAAKNIAKEQKAPLNKITRLRVVRGDFSMREFFQKGNKKPVREKVYASCSVETARRKLNQEAQ